MTCAPSRTPRASREEKSASRTRSLVGRVRSPPGVRSRRPPASPLMIRVTETMMRHARRRDPTRGRSLGSALLEVGGTLGVEPVGDAVVQLLVPGEVLVLLEEDGGVLTGGLDELLVAQHRQVLQVGARPVLGGPED